MQVEEKIFFLKEVRVHFSSSLLLNTEYHFIKCKRTFLYKLFMFLIIHLSFIYYFIMYVTKNHFLYLCNVINIRIIEIILI